MAAASVRCLARISLSLLLISVSACFLFSSLSLFLFVSLCLSLSLSVSISPSPFSLPLPLSLPPLLFLCRLEVEFGSFPQCCATLLLGPFCDSISHFKKVSLIPLHWPTSKHQESSAPPLPALGLWALTAAHNFLCWFCDANSCSHVCTASPLLT